MRQGTAVGFQHAVIVAVLAAAGGVARAEPPPPLDVAVGFDGGWRVGSWTPLVISSTTAGLRDGEPVSVWVEDPDGQFVRSPPAVAAATADGRVEARFSVRFGRPTGRLRIGHGPTVLAPEPPPTHGDLRLAGSIPSTERVIVTYGRVPAGSRAARLLDREQGTTTRVIEAAAAGAIAFAARDYDAADAVIVCGSAVADLPPSAVAALDAWVSNGGRLVFLAGGSAATIATGSTAATRWLPGEFTSLLPLRRLGAVEAYARAGGLAERVPAEGLLVPQFSGRTAGVVDVAAFEGAGGLPLMVRRAYGMGTITWMGLDLDLGPLLGWSGCDTLLMAALGGRIQSGLERPLTESGDAADLAGQLRSALDTFPMVGGGSAVRPVPFELIAGLGLLYVLCLYPFDWWFVSRQGRPWLAWLTLPVLAIGFSAAAWGLKDRWGIGREPLAHTAEVVDFDAADGRVRGSSWAAVIAAGNGRLDVAVSADEASGALSGSGVGDGAAVSWCESAGRGFGGLDAAVPHPSLAAADYGYEETLARLDGVPIAAASSRVFEAEWSAAVREPVVTATLARTEQGTLAGGVAHHLPFPLVGCRLLHAGWLYDLGTLRPGERYDTASGRGPRSLASAITRRAAAKDRDTATRWDRATTDIDRILEVASFHAAAGGPSYTGLDAGRLARLDMTPLLTVDRAVLVGVADGDRHGTAWTIGLRGVAANVEPRPAAATLCRIVIPLATEPAP